MTDHEEHAPTMDWKETLKTNFLFSRPFWWMAAANAFQFTLIWHIINRDSDKLALSVVLAIIGQATVASLYWVARDQAKEVMLSIASVIRNWKSPAAPVA